MACVTSDEGSGQKLTLVAGGKRRVSERQSSMSDSDNASAGFTNREDIPHERAPLIRPRRASDQTDDGFGIDNERQRYGAIPRRQTIQTEPDSRLLDKVSAVLSMRSGSVMSFLLIVVLGIVLTAAANLDTDRNGVEVEPRHVLIYIMFLITVFIAWISVCILPQKFQYSSRHDGALIPSHLLTGIGIFGTVCAITQMLAFVDFVKCSRHVHNLSVVYGIYPFFKTFFVYFQIYFFYKLSRDGIRDRKVPGGNFFIMVTLATNMCIWGVAFLNDASNDPKMKGVTWLNHYHYGVNGYDPCANETITSLKAQQLHKIITSLQPYIAAFSMEYALLASGLLLHIWMVIKAPQSSRVHKPEPQIWTLWRFGFILGLLSIPLLFVAYISEVARAEVSTAKAFLYAFKAIVFFSLVLLGRHSIVLLNRRSGFVKKTKPMKLEVILLGISFIGFPALDLSCAFAAVSEVNNLPLVDLIWYGVSAVCEVIAVGIQFLFIKKAYQHKLPEVACDKVRKAAQFIRQYASYALVVNIGHWAAKTYELRRRTNNPSVAETFFGKYTWFALSHVAYPICIFFHFHLAICYASVVFSFSQFGPLHSSG